MGEQHRLMTLRLRHRPHGETLKLKVHDLKSNQASVLQQVSAEHVPDLKRKQRLRMARSADLDAPSPSS